MMTATLAVLVTVIAIASVLTLIDCVLRAQSAYGSLKRQSALVQAGFVPQVEAQTLRMRPSLQRPAAGATRPFAKRLPRRGSVPARLRGAA
ncbi:hypothetical protein [Erythrobacter sp. MTPC3]|uniref:hypothetical protein n=1 Tax=Erythrobacter sp. MTPC3 TaxID=3056564 RepID=UPI0036F2DBEC